MVFEGEEVTITARDYEGWIFEGWGYPDFIGSTNSITQIMKEDLLVPAIYMPDMTDEDNDTIEFYYEMILVRPFRL